VDDKISSSLELLYSVDTIRRVATSTISFRRLSHFPGPPVRGCFAHCSRRSVFRLSSDSASNTRGYSHNRMEARQTALEVVNRPVPSEAFCTQDTKAVEFFEDQGAKVGTISSGEEDRGVACR